MKASLTNTPILICATVIAALVLGGTFGLLLLGRPIPEWVPVFDAAIMTAYFGAGPFSVALGHLQAATQQAGTTNLALIDTTNHAIAGQREATSALIRAGAPASAGTGQTT